MDYGTLPWALVMSLILFCRAKSSSLPVSVPPLGLLPPGVVLTPSRLLPSFLTIGRVPMPVKACISKLAVCGFSGPDTVSSPMAKITGIEAAVAAMGEDFKLSGRENVHVNTFAPVLAGNPDLRGCTLKGTTASATAEGRPFMVALRCEMTATDAELDGQHTYQSVCVVGVRGQ